MFPLTVVFLYHYKKGSSLNIQGAPFYTLFKFDVKKILFAGVKNKDLFMYSTFRPIFSINEMFDAGK